MVLGLRLFFGFLVITGVAAFFVLRVFVTEIKPSVSEVMEDLLVDTANLLAEIAVPEMLSLAPGQVLSADTSHVAGPGTLARAAQAYTSRAVDAQIWHARKRSLDLRILLTDPTGRVVFDSGTPAAVGEDYSAWRDVALTLRGEYGARTSPDPASADSSVMHVAAPVRHAGQLLGVLVVAKPLSTVTPFVRRAEDKILWSGALLLGASLLVGVVVTLWAVVSVRKLRHYAQAVGAEPTPGGPAPQPPALAGELGDLAQAMDQMRRRLEGREHLEHHVRALTHELKSPVAAIRGAAELLQDELPESDRQRFVRQVDEQSLRLQHIVAQMLELSKLESLSRLPHLAPVDLVDLTRQVLAHHAAALQQRNVTVNWSQDVSVILPGDAARLTLALSNVLSNALNHAPSGSSLDLSISRGQTGSDPALVCWTLRDFGPGVPDFAVARLGERFFAPASEGQSTRGSGLGLAIVRQVLALHGGQLHIELARPGLRVSLALPG